MHLSRTLPALLLALALTACGDDEEPDVPDAGDAPNADLVARADAVLACTTEQGLPGSIGIVEDGVPAIDLTTETETIVVQLFATEAAAAAFQNAADLDQEQIETAVILGGAISPEHRAVIVECLEEH
jgi:hypothetical protein